MDREAVKQAPGKGGTAVKPREIENIGPLGPSDGPKVATGRIRAFMELFGVSVTEMARAAGVDRSYVSKLLGGQVRATPRLLSSVCSGIEVLGREKRVDSSSLIE